VTCRQTVDDFIEDASKIRITIGSPNDIYAEEATSLIDRTLPSSPHLVTLCMLTHDVSL
jgi:hypothetical protein